MRTTPLLIEIRNIIKTSSKGSLVYIYIHICTCSSVFYLSFELSNIHIVCYVVVVLVQSVFRYAISRGSAAAVLFRGFRNTRYVHRTLYRYLIACIFAWLTIIGNNSLKVLNLHGYHYVSVV